MFTLFFLYAPLVILALYAFNKGVTRSWPPDLWTTKWFSAAWNDDLLAGALRNSILAAIGATAIALALGSRIRPRADIRTPSDFSMPSMPDSTIRSWGRAPLGRALHP